MPTKGKQELLTAQVEGATRKEGVLAGPTISPWPPMMLLLGGVHDRQLQSDLTLSLPIAARLSLHDSKSIILLLACNSCPLHLTILSDKVLDPTIAPIVFLPTFAKAKAKESSKIISWPEA